ncbi:MAG: sulfite exporter TauE/SafE family protein [Chromatiales bacterium]|nr:sulfite exporter TauE/SafE family protein [Chromatiales bacterium]
MEINFIEIVLLMITGLMAGVINTLAGGGSNLTLPVMMVMGMPADIANATNRVGIFLQCIVGIAGFHKHKKLDSHDLGPILWPTLLGGLIGALFASYAPEFLLKPLLLGVMLTMTLIILIRPSIIIPSPDSKPKRVADSSQSWWMLLLAGFYGGFVQAGVGFILIAALAGSLRYDLVRANALKLVCSLGFTTVALIIFVINNQVLWLPGLILAVGTMSGAHIAVKFAIRVKASTLKWFLFIMTLSGSLAAMIY